MTWLTDKCRMRTKNKLNWAGKWQLWSVYLLFNKICFIIDKFCNINLMLKWTESTLNWLELNDDTIAYSSVKLFSWLINLNRVIELNQINTEPIWAEQWQYWLYICMCLISDCIIASLILLLWFVFHIWSSGNINIYSCCLYGQSIPCVLGQVCCFDALRSKVIFD